MRMGRVRRLRQQNERLHVLPGLADPPDHRTDLADSSKRGTRADEPSETASRDDLGLILTAECTDLTDTKLKGRKARRAVRSQRSAL